MADVTDVLAIPFPEGGDTFAAAAVQGVAERVDEAPGVESLTAAEIAALTSAQKPAGRVVYNSDTSKLQVSNGTSFSDMDAAALASAALKLPLAGGTMSGNVAMGGSKVTGLGAATTAGDAVRYEQAMLLAGGTMTGAIAMGSNKVTGMGSGTASTDAVTKSQLDGVSATASAALPKAGGLMTGTLQLDQSVKLQGPYPAVGDLTIHTPTGQVVLQGPPGTHASGQIAHANATYANQSATLGQIPSSRDVKKAIRPLTEQQAGAFDKVAPVAFEYRAGHGPNEVEQQGVHLGFIAEDVKAAGMRVLEDPDGTVFGLQPIELIAVLWAKVQDLEAQLTTLKEGS